ncbi:MAG: tetratricopeptide repeat protein [Candidatus Sumerlaeaceae bacterium]|nr:tetratricopeptide repeat protein [Candidatus Sumerlaeaceae bacterium]
MKRLMVILVVFAIVAAALAGGASFIMQQNKLGKLKRVATQAEEKIALNEYDDAIQLLQRIEQDGGTARSAYLLGKSYYSSGRMTQAMPWFQKIQAKYASSNYMPDAMLYQARYAMEVTAKPAEAREICLKILENYPDSDAVDFALYYLAKISFDAGDIPQARKNLDVVLKRKDSPARDEAEFILGDMNMKALKSGEGGADVETYIIKKGDNLWKLERQFKAPIDLIVGINGINPKALSVGSEIKIPRLDISIVVDKTKRVLIVRNGPNFFKKYKIAINKTDARIPAKDYKITIKSEKGRDFTNLESNSVVKASDPANPLGDRWIEISKDLGIHGGATPEVLGKPITNGYIAMTNADVEELYALVRIGTPVTIKGKVATEESPGNKTK